MADRQLGMGQGEGEPSGFLYTLPGILLAVLGYSLVHIVARLIASGNLGEDDPLDNLLIQSFSLGYSAKQPPLYDWLLWGLQQVMGTGVHAFLVLKYGLLVAMAGFLFLIARRLTGSVLWALLAVDAMALVYQIFWRFHEGFTHRVGAMTLAVVTLWALLRLLDRGRWRDYSLFGMSVGLGLLTEHSYAVLLLALLAAALLQPKARSRILAAPMWMVPLIAMLIVSPYASWVATDAHRLAAFWTSVLPFPQHYTLPGLAHALSNAVTFPVLVLAPYILILPLVFPGMLRVIVHGTPIRVRPDAAPDFKQLVLHALLLQVAWLVLVDALLFQYAGYAVHGLLPMFVIAIVWLTAKAQESDPGPRRIRRFVALTLAITVIALLGRVANMYVLDPVCSICRWGTPYAGLATQMRAAGFEHGSIMTTEIELAGNLRRFFPDDRFIVVDSVVPPETDTSRGGQVAIVWNAKGDQQATLSRLRPYLPSTVTPENLQPALIQVPWQHFWRPDGYRQTDWQLVILGAAGANNAGQGPESQAFRQ